MMKTKMISLIVLAWLLAGCQQPVPAMIPSATATYPEVEATSLAPSQTPFQEFQPYFEESSCPFEVPEPHVEGRTVICGYVIVPEDHHKPGGKVIKLAVAIFKAPSENAPAAPLIFLSGGPGEKTIAYVLPLAERMASLNAGGDLVFFDQRGVGSSQPALECPEYVESLYGILDEPDPTAAQITVFEAILACRDRLVEEGHNLAAYTTAQNAADVESIRQALGFEQINLLGGSYGSLLAQAVMRDYPDHIRSVIIDSTVPMEKSLLIDIPTTSVNATLHLMESCAVDQACSAAYPDLQEVLYDIIEAHNQEPVPVTLVNPLDGAHYEALLSGDMLFSNLVFFLYQTPIIPTLPKAISDVARGDYTLMIQLSSQRLAAYDAISRGMSFSILCTDDLIERTPEDYMEIRAALPPVLAGRTDPEVVIEYGYFAICKNWPVKKSDSSARNPVVSDIPTLILEGEFDPVTPPEYGRMVAEHLNNSYFFEFPGIGHSVAVADPCARQVAADFLAKPTSKPDDSCRKNMGIEFMMPVDLKNLALVTVTIAEFGIQTLVPEGWTQVKPEYYISPDATIELVVMENTEDDREEFLQKWGASQPISESESNGLAWKLYESSLPDYNIAGYIATAPSKDGFYMVLIVTTPAQQEDVFDSVFIPVMEAFSVD